MEIEIFGVISDIDEDLCEDKWKFVLNNIDFYCEKVKKFTSLYCEVYSIKKNRELNSISNLLPLNLMVLSKIFLDDNKEIQYSCIPSIVKDFIIPIFIKKEDINENMSDQKKSEELMETITDALSDYINEKISMTQYSIVYVETLIDKIETKTTDNGDLNINIYSKFDII